MSRPDGQTWKANLHDIRLREEADLYLSVRSDIPAWQVAEKFLHSVRRVHLMMSARSMVLRSRGSL
jgi:predicted component of type VI protein secretion system